MTKKNYKLDGQKEWRELADMNEERRGISNSCLVFDGCIWVYPVVEWQLIEQKVAALPQLNDRVKALQRVFISAATECPIDKQGRILVPPTLREYAGLTKDIVMVGMTKRVEIWSKDRWIVEFEKSQKRIDAGDLTDIGL